MSVVNQKGEVLAKTWQKAVYQFLKVSQGMGEKQKVGTVYVSAYIPPQWRNVSPTVHFSILFNTEASLLDRRGIILPMEVVLC